MRLRDFYQAYPPEGVEITRRVHKAAALLKRFAPPAAPLLDVGCGAGAVASFIAGALGSRVVKGVEVAEPAAELARARGLDVVSLDLNSDRLPFDDGAFGAVFCGEVIEHLVDTDHLMAEIYRVLSAGGVCVITTPNLAAWYNRAALLFGYQPFLTQVSFRHAPGRPPFLGASGGGHLRVFTYKALVDFARLNGFDVVARRGAGVFEIATPAAPGWARLLFRSIDSLFTPFPSLACDVLLALRKSSAPPKDADG